MRCILLLILFLFSLSACKKPIDKEVQKPNKNPWYFAFAGKYAGIITNYNYGSLNSNTEFKTYSAHIAHVILNKDSSGLLADGIPLDFRSDSSGRFAYVPGIKAGEFIFTFDKTDTTLFYFYNGRPDNVRMVEFTGKKQH